MEGYIRLYKQLIDNPIWTDKPFARGQAWIDLLMMANYANGTMFSKGSSIPVKRGQVFRTIKFLSQRWGWSEKKTRRFLTYLCGESMVSVEGIAQGTLITIENYTFYQCDGRADDQTDDLAEDRADDPPREDKRIKNNKELNNITSKSLENEFEELWQIYPKKEGRKKALESYKRSRKKGTTFDEVKAGIEKYNAHIKANGTDRQYIKMGSTYFNNESWKDIYETQETYNGPSQEELVAEAARHYGMTPEEFERLYGHAK